MGYRIEVDDQTERFLGLIQTNPETMFPRPYAAYILFLFGHVDEVQAKWMLENADFLDSLTGTTVAFAVFSQCFDIPGRHRLTSDLTLPKIHSIEPYEVERSHAASRLLMSGAKLELDEGQLRAITYGTDKVALKLGVLDRIPCMVILHGLPGESPCTISLNDEVLPKLRSIFRSAISNFSADGNAMRILAAAQSLSKLSQAVTDWDAETRRLESRRRAVTAKMVRARRQLDKNPALFGSRHPAAIAWAELSDQREEIEAALGARNIDPLGAGFVRLEQQIGDAPLIPLAKFVKRALSEARLTQTMQDSGKAASNYLLKFFSPENIAKFLELFVGKSA